MNEDELFINVNKLPKPLPKDELNKLFNEFHSGSDEAKNKIALHNIRLVIKIANKYRKNGYELKEIIAIGTLGLTKAINTFDPAKKIAFITYASRCVENEILMFLRRDKKNKNTDSIDKIIYTDKNGQEITIEDKLSDDNDFVDDFLDTELNKYLRNYVANLNDRDKKIIMMYFGFTNNEQHTTTEIADILSLSQSYISRLIIKILKQMGKDLEDIGLIDLHTKEVKVKKNEQPTSANVDKKMLNEHIKQEKVQIKSNSTISSYKNKAIDSIPKQTSENTNIESEGKKIAFWDDIGLTKENFYSIVLPNLSEHAIILIQMQYGKNFDEYNNIKLDPNLAKTLENLKKKAIKIYKDAMRCEYDQLLHEYKSEKNNRR